MLAGMLVADGASADDKAMTVQELYEDCNGGPGSWGLTYCLGYVGGIADTMGLNSIAFTPMTPADVAWMKIFSLCDQATYGAYIRGFRNWAQAHPEKWTDQANFGVVTALHLSWPCK